MRILRIGDPHVRPSNLEESERLMQFIYELAHNHQVDMIEILGDLFHTHAILRIEVITFWQKWLAIFSKRWKTIVLVGNHDMSGDFKNGQHALQIFSETANLVIVSDLVVSGKIGYMPYVHDKEKFVENAKELFSQGARVLVCHATIDGSKFDNGFYAPDGMPMLPQFTHVISGHIHAIQEFGNVIYPGTGRWDSISEANQPKGIWIYDHDDNGKIVKRDFYTTESVCLPIFAFQWREGEEAPSIPPNCRASLEAIGSSDFCAKAKALYKGQASFKSKITDQARKENRKSGRSLKEFLAEHYPIDADRRARLMKFMEEIKLV